MNLIITDCFDSKLDALRGVCTEVFGLHKYKIISNKPLDYPAPLSSAEMERCLSEKMQALETFFGSEKETLMEGGMTAIYFASTKLGFLQMNKGWMIYAAAVFRKQHDVCFTGQTEASAIKKELWPFISLAEEERHQKFAEFDNMLKFHSLIYYMRGKGQTDWYKEAWRNCVPTAVRF